MAPNHGFLLQSNNMAEPVSRTYQYRKVMKPMLERKRRARINRCLDELKELMTGALQTEGENVAKLEKADILELTVRHLHTLRRQNQLAVRPDQTYADRFKAGFRHCAAEVTTFLSGLDQTTRVHLTTHLSGCIRRLEGYQPQPSDIPDSKDISPPLQWRQNSANNHNGRPTNHYNNSNSNSNSPPQQAPQQNIYYFQPSNENDHPANDVRHHLQHHHHHHQLPTASRVNTPPQSPNSGDENGPVWRPW